jgi:hypothetical protein
MCEIDKKLLGIEYLPEVLFADISSAGLVAGTLNQIIKGSVVMFGVSLGKAAERGQSFDITQIFREGRSDFPVYAVFDRVEEYSSGRFGIFCRRFIDCHVDYKKEMEFFDLLTITRIIVVARPGTFACDVINKLIEKNSDLIKKLRRAEFFSRKLRKLFSAEEE